MTPAATSPLSFAAIGPFAPSPKGAAALRDITVATLDAALADMVGSVRVLLPEALHAEGHVTVPLRELDDFAPERLAALPLLRTIQRGIDLIGDARNEGQPDYRIRETLLANGFGNILDLAAPPNATVPSSAPSPAPATPGSGKSGADALFDLIDAPASATPGGSAAAWSSQLRRLGHDILAAIASDPALRTLEAAWRGLALVCAQPEAREGLVRIRFAALPDPDVAASLAALEATILDSMPSLCLVDHPFGPNPADLDGIKAVADFAETGLIPSLAWAGPSFLRLDDWAGLDRLPNLSTHMETAAFAAWRSFRATPAAAWLGLCCNRIPARARHEADPAWFGFQEPDDLWLAPVWPAAALAMRSLAATGSFMAMAHAPVATLRDLPLPAAYADSETVTEMALSEHRAAQFAAVGLMPLVGVKRADAVVLAAQTATGGKPFHYPFFLNRLAGAVYEAKAALADLRDPAAVEERLAAHLQTAFGRIPTLAPKRFGVQCVPMNGGMVLRVQCVPPEAALPGDPIVSLDFDW
ncbi:MAG: type VI secretion system contractile sheath large subunit [Desulfovibrionaceae bacterium]